MAEKNVVDRLATIRNHPLRRKILQAAEEAHAQGRLVSPVGLHRQLEEPIGGVSYHVKVLREEGALKLLETVPRRGASEHLYGINEDLLAEITDVVALDRIAELIDGATQMLGTEQLQALQKVVKSTGRPVEA